MPSVINSDDGVVSGTSGLKTTGGNDGILALQNNGTTNVTVTAAGNVGIGTSSPSFPLDVAGAARSNSWIGRANVSAPTADAAVYRAADNTLAFSTANTERARITSGGDFQFNSGYGSVATAYGCRAWVNFNGTGVVAIRASGNVTSITDNGTGDYTVNFTTAMPDANYAVSMSGGTSTSNGRICQPVRTAPSTSSQRVLFQDGAFNGFDTDYCFVAIFR